MSGTERPAQASTCLDEPLSLDRSLSLDEAVRVHMFVTKENHTSPAHSARGQVHLHSVLTDSMVQRSSLLQGISESSGACPVPLAQPDVYAWLSVVAARDSDEDEVQSAAATVNLPPDMAKPASVISVCSHQCEYLAFDVRRLLASSFHCWLELQPVHVVVVPDKPTRFQHAAKCRTGC